MAARRRDTGPQLDRPGQPPLLQGHLKAGGRRPGEPEREGEQVPTPAAGAAQPAIAGSAATPTAADVTSGKATKTPAEVATRPHLEGSEQGPN